MKERPILFSAPMVRAILEGRKTQTRRILKPQPTWHNTNLPTMIGNTAVFGVISDNYPQCDWKCPYGQPGDRLWVKETHLCTAADEVHFRADGNFPEGAAKMLGGWRPSIFMFRRFSRILLEITAVRVERLQDISDEDALAEGVHRMDWEYENGECCETARDAYAMLWDHINGAGSWDANPWVWCVSFKRIE